MTIDYPIPNDLRDWLVKNNASYGLVQESVLMTPMTRRKYVLATVDLVRNLFRNHEYNPRETNPGKVNELKGSISQIGLLSPLTCSYVEGGEPVNGDVEPEKVVLIDGRHRYKALSELSDESRSTLDSNGSLKVDLKIYIDLNKSDRYILATYLNRIRQPLKKGEYFKALVDIYDTKALEMIKEDGKPHTEKDIFNAIHARQLTNRNLDLSIGRIVGIVAFDTVESDTWAGLVGEHQNKKFNDSDGITYYCPLTAGNLAEFLRYLCKAGPYDDFGEKRAIEIKNVIKLGRLFRNIILTEPAKDHETVTPTTVGCKFWCLAAFGDAISKCKEITSLEEGAILSSIEIDWGKVEKILHDYFEIMKPQADLINSYKNSRDENSLKEAWSYQTQREQVAVPLRRELEKRGFNFYDQ